MEGDAYLSFIVTDLTGQVLIQKQLNASRTTVNTSNLSPGLYYITFTGDNGSSIKKFVKM